MQRFVLADGRQAPPTIAGKLRGEVRRPALAFQRGACCTPPVPFQRPLICRSSACGLPAGVRQQLEVLGVPDNVVRDVRDLHDFAANAEDALVILTGLASPQRVATLLEAHPELLCAPLGTWLDFLSVYGLSRRDFFRLLSANPRLFTASDLYTAGSAIAFLQRLGLSPRDVSASVIPRCSRLLLLDCAARLQPAADLLRAELGLDPAGLRDLLCRCPALLTLDSHSELAPRLAVLRAAGFESQEDVRRLVWANTALLTGDPAAALRQRLGFLTSGCGFSGDQALGLLRACPELLALSEPNLTRKWRFLTERMHGGAEQVLEYPQFWAKSLLLDIGPRYAYVVDRGLLPRLESSSAAPADWPDEAATQVRGGGRDEEWGDRYGGEWSPYAGEDAAACAATSAPGLSLRLLLDSDDLAFVQRVWQASRSGRAGTRAHAGAAAGEGLEWGRDGGPGPGGMGVDAESVDPWDYQRFRAGWQETEGTRWSGVNAVGAAAIGSW